ncbi:MAG TPA: DUF1559 domain-containing protein [Pirellulales bacterium]
MSFFESKPEPEQDPLFLPPGTREWEKQERKDAGWSRATLAFVGLIFAAFIASAIVKGIGSAREAARTASCSCHLKQLGLALHTYHEDYGCFPPAYIVDSQGRKMHSWRALLLPYVGGDHLKYDMNEPWDGPNNRKLWDQMPSTYRCPSDDTSPPNTTSYVAVVGPNTMWPGAKSVSFKHFRDSSSNTIAVVEGKNLAVPWLEPRDLEEESLSLKINDSSTNTSLSSAHSEGVMVLLADGSAKFLRSTTDPQLLKALLTIAGGEPASVP